MTCERCDGLMVSEQICDLQGLSSDLCVDGYRCLLCGDVVYATIIEHKETVQRGDQTASKHRSFNIQACAGLWRHRARSGIDAITPSSTMSEGGSRKELSRSIPF